MQVVSTVCTPWSDTQDSSRLEGALVAIVHFMTASARPIPRRWRERNEKGETDDGATLDEINTETVKKNYHGF